MNENMELALKAYYFVPYNISQMQMGIQAGHAGWRYARKFFENPQTWEFVDNHETTIILDGGTTNSRRDLDGIALGTMNQIADALAENEIPFTFFEEPDINDALTALCFIADERVFDKEKYPDFMKWFIDNYRVVASAQEIVTIRMLSNEELIEYAPDRYKEWVRLIGGVKNVFLRDLLKDKKLAR